MSANTKIEWTERSWNPNTGCSIISPGCINCYAKRMTKRLMAMGQPKYRDGFEVRCHPELLDEPRKWNKDQMVFVNSMSDTFHKEIPSHFIQDIFSVMDNAQNHVFQVLTKRSERLKELSDELNWTDNIWMGVTVENDDYLYRIDDLRATDAHTKFISFEPLLSPLQSLDLSGIDWVIVGGESGPGSRPMEKQWVLEIQAECQRHKVPFFFKQWGGTNKKKAGRLLDGRTWNEMPVKYIG